MSSAPVLYCALAPLFAIVGVNEIRKGDQYVAMCQRGLNHMF